jgi:plasmid stability protein
MSDASNATIACMASLHIRNVPESTRRGLRLRAARKSRSMEAEARAILAKAVQGETGMPFDAEALQDFVVRLFDGKPPRLTDELIRGRRREARQERQL